MKWLGLIYPIAFVNFLLAQDFNIDTNKNGWGVELKRISLNFSSTSIKNQDVYKNFSNSLIRGDSQVVMQGSGEFNANYYAKNFVVFNSLITEYGRNIINPENGSRVDNKTLDRILLSTDYTQRIWHFPNTLGGFELGPYAQLSYQTQFTPQTGMNRIKILRFAGGFKIFEGGYIKNLYLNLFGEEDFTYARPAESLGIQTGLDIEQKIRDDVTLNYHLNFRDYIVNNYQPSRNPQYELDLDIRMKTKLYKNFSVAPFLTFYLLKGRYYQEVGTSLFIGVSISYNQVFLEAKPK